MFVHLYLILGYCGYVTARMLTDGIYFGDGSASTRSGSSVLGMVHVVYFVVGNVLVMVDWCN